MFEIVFKKSSQEDFAQKCFVWPKHFFLHRPWVKIFFETRVNFGWLYVGLKDPLPPLAIHILKALDVPFHMVPPNICHTY